MMGTWEHQIPSAKLMSTFADVYRWGIPGGERVPAQRQDMGYAMNPPIRVLLESKKT